MSKVFVIQKQMRFCDKVQDLVPKFDVGAALQYGQIEYLLSPSASPFHVDTIVPEISRKLSSMRKEDHLLLLGNPCLIGLVCAIAADKNFGRLNLLQWSGTEQRYIPVVYDNIYD